jgi:NAD(P)-dependent dehydrogenase (short-subunit alcohol dehydrogenase family)
MSELHRRHAHRLDGKVVAITGASRGLGAAMAVGAAGAGADVVLLARTRSDMDVVARHCSELGTSSLALECDVTSEESVNTAVRTIENTFGRLDGWINNAGICMEIWRRDHIANGGVPFEELTIEGWRMMVDVNLTGPFICLQAALPLLLRSGRGSVINILTLAFEKIGYTPYGASKSGLYSMTRSLAEEYAGRVRVNALSPGGVTWSSMIGPEVYPPGAPVMQTTVMVPPTVFLLSDDAKDVTGESLVAKRWNISNGYPVEVAAHVPADI